MPDAIFLQLHLVLLSLMATLLTSGCAQIGPEAMRASRLSYNEAVQASDQRELLLNLVRLRYTDAPEFLQINGISTQIRFETGANIGGDFGEVEDANSAFVAPSASVGYSESPTISFHPRRDQEFTRQLVAPIEIDSVYLLTHYGWGVDRVLLLIAKEINGVANRTTREAVSVNESERDSFREIVSLLNLLSLKRMAHIGAKSRSETIMAHVERESVSVDDLMKVVNKGFQLEEKPEKDGYILKKVTNHYVIEIDQKAWNSNELKRLGNLLQIKPGHREYEIDYKGEIRNNSIRISTRSVLGVMAYLSGAVSVPGEHMNLVSTSERPDPLLQKILQIKVAKTFHDDMHHAVKYRDHWFYISDQDLESKRTFGLLTSLIRLNINAGGAQNVPVLTLPVSQR